MHQIGSLHGSLWQLPQSPGCRSCSGARTLPRSSCSPYRIMISLLPQQQQQLQQLENPARQRAAQTHPSRQLQQLPCLPQLAVSLSSTAIHLYGARLNLLLLRLQHCSVHEQGQGRSGRQRQAVRETCG